MECTFKPQILEGENSNEVSREGKKLVFDSERMYERNKKWEEEKNNKLQKER